MEDDTEENQILRVFLDISPWLRGESGSGQRMVNGGLMTATR
jgi:hypothetical protein